MKLKLNKKLGFTLAEILITLSIIGVVAALTIPTLIQRTGNEEYVSRLMKTYSTLSQATEAIMTKQGAVSVWASNLDNVYTAYKEQLRASKDCGTGTGCFKQWEGIGKNLDGSTWSQYNLDSSDKVRKLILSDGTAVMFSLYTDRPSAYDEWKGVKDAYIAITADINGAKSPNIWGRDLFFFVVKKDGLYPAGVNAPSIEDTCNPKGASRISIYGQGCAARVIAEGDMNY